jgi:putative addiction module component (TIGR02574 family)
MSNRQPSGILADALSLPARDRLALAAELINSVEGESDDQWDAAWLAELDRRERESSNDPASLEDWESVRAQILRELRSP